MKTLARTIVLVLILLPTANVESMQLVKKFNSYKQNNLFTKFETYKPIIEHSDKNVHTLWKKIIDSKINNTTN